MLMVTVVRKGAFFGVRACEIARAARAGISVAVLFAFGSGRAVSLPLEPSSRCAACHQIIYAQWANSLHANALSDPIFVAYFRGLTGRDRESCLECHAPMAVALKDPGLANALSREGVSCEFCHRVVRGEPGTGRLVTDLGGPRRGPLADALGKYHPVAFSEFHTRAEFCAGCHQSVNANGVAVLNTYEEWKQSAYAGAGVTCQKCHMPEDINQSAAQLREVTGRHTLISHQFVGGHSQTRLQNAASLSMVPVWKRDGIEVSVFVTNKESGHRLPTGLPSRRVVLKVSLHDRNGSVLASLSRVYQRTLKDAQGVRIPDREVNRLFLESAGVFRDNRIAPGETRRENFTFPAPSARRESAYSVEATLTYFLPLPFGDPPEIQVTMARAEALLRHPSAFSSVLYVLNVIVLILGMAVLVATRKNAGGKTESG
ncbi:MAG: multiheme c-type cytochrome [bacterium JZ-2024 1]